MGRSKNVLRPEWEEAFYDGAWRLGSMHGVGEHGAPNSGGGLYEWNEGEVVKLLTRTKSIKKNTRRHDVMFYHPVEHEDQYYQT